ncbi:MAG: hypothetical protein ACPG0L_06520 [Bacteroidia bacterium]
MSKNWLDIIRKQFSEDKVTPPDSSWENIREDLWTKNIESKFQENSQATPPHHLSKDILQKVPHSSIGVSTLLKISAGILGVAASVSAIIFYTQNSPNTAGKTISSVVKSTEPITGNRSPVFSNTDQHEVINKETNTSSNVQATNKLNTTFPSENTSHSETKSNAQITVSPAESQELSEYSNVNEDIIGKTLEASIVPQLILETSSVNLNPYIAQKRRLNHTFQWSMGIEKQVKSAYWENSGERYFFSKTPIQRDYGAHFGLLWNKHWKSKIGLYTANGSYKREFRNTPFFKTPVKMRPKKRLITISAENYSKEIDATNVALFPRGVSPTDTSKYYRIDYLENVNFSYWEVPITLGYQTNFHRLSLGINLGGRFLITRKIDALFELTINNPANQSFQFQYSKASIGKTFFQGFIELQSGCKITKYLGISGNLLIPNMLTTNSPYIRQVKGPMNVRATLSLNYNF